MDLKCSVLLLGIVTTIFLFGLAIGNKIVPPVIDLQCTSKLLSLKLTSNADFKGVVYIGDQNRDCRILGKGTSTWEISLPVRQCGIITAKSDTDSSKVIHKVIIYVQLHPQVQQMSDIRIVQSCVAPAVDAATTTGAEGAILDPDQQKVQITAPSWMEVVRGGRLDGPKIRGPVKVGETIGILVKANVKGNQDSLVTSCYASDGTSAEPEMFVNEDGCPTDSSVVPAFTRIKDGSDSVTQIHWTKFPAFKFPDRTRLYLTCQVVVCDYACPKPRCMSLAPDSHTRQVRQDVTPNDNWSQARVVDRVDVVNSVRVVNPDLEGLSPNDAIAMEETADGSKRVCWPLKSLMTAIGILAAILLLCLLLALCFWWNRRQRKRRQFDSSYGTQTNSMYNPSTNYYAMHHYPDSQQHSANGGGRSTNGGTHSEPYEPDYAPAASRSSAGLNGGGGRQLGETRRNRDQNF